MHALLTPFTSICSDDRGLILEFVIRPTISQLNLTASCSICLYSGMKCRPEEVNNTIWNYVRNSDFESPS